MLALRPNIGAYLKLKTWPQEQRVPSYAHLWQDAVRRQERAAADVQRPPEGATFMPRLHAPRARLAAAPGARPSIADRCCLHPASRVPHPQT